MLRVLILSVLLAVALSHSNSIESNENLDEKRGHCPNAASNSSVAACSTPCPVGTNCTNVSCSSDTNCTGVLKCCNTNCGLMCVDPVYKTVCDDNDDCPGTLVCCKRSCATVCVIPTPAKKGKGKKGK